MPEAATPPPLLTLTSVRIDAGGATLVEEFDFRLAAGQAAAFVGPPGCGKALLLRVAAGLERPAAGERHAAPCRSAFVFQRGGLISNVTVEENLLLPLYYQRLKHAAARDRASAALEDFGLSAVARHLPGKLLDETRLTVQFARAAALDVDMLFLDEPFPHFSRHTAARVEQWLQSGVGAGRLAVLMTGAERDAVPNLPTRCLEIGRPGRFGPRDETSAAVAPP
jgi:ABC-type nitrate/sulfonate/bicarbonate transport system ATPase subunit